MKNMAEEVQRVVVILGVSKDVPSKAIMKALEKTRPQAGDEVTFIAVLEQISSPMGFKLRVHDDSFLAPNRKIVGGLLAKIREDFEKSSEIMKLSEYCETKNMDFNIDVVSHPFKEVASHAEKNLGATWLIVDRRVTRDEKKSRLPCGIITISDNTVQKFWAPDVPIRTTNHIPHVKLS